MKLIFGTTNKRKTEDLQNIINKMKLDIEVLSMEDIGWDRGEIDEYGTTVEENSLIKAQAILSFCQEHNIQYPIMTDDAGLFVEALNGEPGVYTARYADLEINQNSDLPKYFALIKMLNNMKDQKNRSCEYRCAITIMFNDGTYKQFNGSTQGLIDTKINEPIKKPYFYSLFVDRDTNTPFNLLTNEQLKNTYRYTTLTKALKFLDLQQSKNINSNNM